MLHKQRWRPAAKDDGQQNAGSGAADEARPEAPRHRRRRDPRLVWDRRTDRLYYGLADVAAGNPRRMAADDNAPDLAVPRPRPGLIWLGILLLLALLAIWRIAPPLAGFAPAAAIGGSFALTDPTGKAVTEAALAGKPYAIFFGYTHCPDVCPTTLSDMTGWLKSLGTDAEKLRLVFVTVDPERDTPAALADYMKAFDPRILALTGSQADVDTILHAYRVYAKKGEVRNGDYAMDHSAAIYLFDGSGRFKTVIGYGEASDAALARLKELIRAG